MLWRPDISPQDGPYDVVIKRGDFVDPARANRKIPYKIYYPGRTDLGKLPVIIWSHGFGGNRDGAAFLSRFVGSYGYVLVHITHIGTDSSLWEGKPGHPWDILRKVSITRETTLERFQDVPFVLDQLPAWAAEQGLSALFDLERLGMSGHSFGAMTSQAMSGQMFPNAQGKLTSYREFRFKAGILYSPVPIRHLVGEEPEPHIYGPIAIPLLHMTGTHDDSPLEGFGYKRRVVVYDYTNHKEKYLLIKNNGDHMVYNGTRGKLEANPNREKHEELTRVISLAFWDAYLKGDKNAKDWLAGTGVQAYIAGEAEFKASVA